MLQLLGIQSQLLGAGGEPQGGHCLVEIGGMWTDAGQERDIRLGRQGLCNKHQGSINNKKKKKNIKALYSTLQNGGQDTVPIRDQGVARSHRHDHLGDAEQAAVDVHALLPGHALVGRPAHPLRPRQIHNIHSGVVVAIPDVNRDNGMGAGAVGVHGRGPDLAIAGAQLEEALQIVLAGQGHDGAALAARRHHGGVGRAA